MAKPRKIKSDVRKLFKTDDDLKASPISILPTLANPITEMATKIETLLANCEKVITEFDFNEKTVWVYVSDPDLVEAYKFFLKRKHSFGGLKLNVKLISTYHGKMEEVDKPSYKISHDEFIRLFKLLFAHSRFEPKFDRVVDQYDTIWDFAEFPGIGLTYQADSLANIKGLQTTLVEDLIRDVFDVGAIHVSSFPVYK